MSDRDGQKPSEEAAKALQEKPEDLRAALQDVLRRWEARLAREKASSPSPAAPIDLSQRERRDGVAIRMGIANGQVVLDFGKNISAVGFEPAAARQIARDILKLAKKASRKGGE